jgi:hypothetical protein
MNLKTWKASGIVAFALFMVVALVSAIVGVVTGSQDADAVAAFMFKIGVCCMMGYVALGFMIDIRRDRMVYEATRDATIAILRSSGGSSSLATLKGRLVAEGIVRVCDVSGAQALDMIQDKDFRHQLENAQDISEIHHA